MTTWTRALWLSLGMTVAACAAPSAPTSSTAPGHLVILISLDTLRADHLGAYGYPRPISPNLDALARRGVVFEDATATAPWTLPSHASMLTGLYPSHHGVIRDELRLPASIPTLAETLRRHGVRTAAAVNAITLSPQNGLDRGFERFRYVPEDPEECAPTTGMTDQVIDWLDAFRGQDAFLFLHDYDIHSDYCALPAWEAPVLRPYDGIIQGSGGFFKLMQLGIQPFDERDIQHLVDQYDAGIFQTDDEVGRLLLNLESRGLTSSTVVIVVADHGEAFYEHGHFRHSRTQYQELLHVPLIMVGPGLPAGARVTAPTSLVDLAPTVAALFGIAPPPGGDGIDLAPLWHGRPVSDRTLFAQANGVDSEAAPWSHKRVVGRPGNDLWMARRGRHKLIVDLSYERSELYDLDADPRETRDASREAPTIAIELSGALRALDDTHRPNGELITLSEEERERLDALGYTR